MADIRRRNLVVLILMTLSSPLHTVRLPRPWLSRTDANVMRIVFQVPEPSGLPGGSLSSAELRFQAGGSGVNVTKAVLTPRGVLQNHLPATASVQIGMSNRLSTSGAPLYDITVTTPFDKEDCGTYVFFVTFTNSRNLSITEFHYFTVDETMVGKERRTIIGPVSVSTDPAYRLNVTWVPPEGSQESDRIATVLENLLLQEVDDPNFPVTREVYQLTGDLTVSGGRDVLHVKYLKPAHTSCGPQNHMLILFMSTISCIPNCTYTCEVRYPECGDEATPPYCMCGAAPAEESPETHVTFVSCDDTTTTTQTTPTPTSTSTSAATSEAPAMITETTTTTSQNHAESRDSSDGCSGRCTVIVAVLCVVILLLVLVITVAVVVLYCKYCRRQRNRRSHISLQSDPGSPENESSSAADVLLEEGHEDGTDQSRGEVDPCVAS